MGSNLMSLLPAELATSLETYLSWRDLNSRPINTDSLAEDALNNLARSLITELKNYLAATFSASSSSTSALGTAWMGLKLMLSCSRSMDLCHSSFWCFSPAFTPTYGSIQCLGHQSALIIHRLPDVSNVLHVTLQTLWPVVFDCPHETHLRRYIHTLGECFLLYSSDHACED